MQVFETHNPGYKELMKDPNWFTKKSERLCLLPEHGELQGLSISEVDVSALKHCGPNEDEDPTNPTSSCSQYPIPPVNFDDVQCFKLFLNNTEARIDQPQQEATGVSEFKEPWLFSKMYPTLFPDGVSDPRMDGRVVNPTIDKYLAFQMEYAEKDPEGNWVYRFVKHRTFSSYVFDMKRRQSVISCSMWSLKKTPELQGMTIEKLKRIINEGTAS